MGLGAAARVAGVVTAVSSLSALPGDLRAQTVQGRVLDEQDDRPVPTALVRLLDSHGGEIALAIADSSGGYRVDAPEPGVYRLVAERLGYDSFETPLLEMTDGTYPLDLLMRRSPVPIRGIEVTADQAEREIQLVIGISPASLRVSPIHRLEIEDHLARSHDLTDLMRWSNMPGIVVRRTTDGPCYQARGRSCLDVYLNGFRMMPETVPLIPLDMIHTIVVLYPGDSIAYAGGAVLLFTEAWLR